MDFTNGVTGGAIGIVGGMLPGCVLLSDARDLIPHLDEFLKSWYSVYDYNTAAGSSATTSARVGFASAA